MDSKTIAWVCYLWWVGWIIGYILYNSSRQKNSLAAFHLRQSLGLQLFALIFWFLGWRLFFGFIILSPLLWVIEIALFVFWILGFISSINGEEKPLPLIGSLFQQWFTFIK